MPKGDPVHIQVTDQYAIGSDPHQWICKYRAKKIDEETGEYTGKFGPWQALTFHSSINNLVESMKGQHLQECGAGSFEELIDAAKEIDKLFSRLHFNVVTEVNIK